MEESSENVIENKKKAARRKYIIAAGFVLLCIIVGYFFKVMTWQSESQKASETIIRQVVAKQLNKDPNYLTNEDFAKITKLKIIESEIGPGSAVLLKNVEISDIKFLKIFTNLESLDLTSITYPQVTIPKWMKIMAKLGIFDLDERFSIDLSPLKKLSHLQSLFIKGNTVKNIKPLIYIKNLRMLDIPSINQIKNKKYIARLTNLQSLYIDNTSIDDISYISNLINLKKLYLTIPMSYNPEPLRKLKNLEIISLRGGFSDLDILKEMIKLTELYIGDTQVSNLELLRGLPNLKKLYLSDTNVYDIEPLRALTNLHVLVISNTKVSNIEALEVLNKLELLAINNTRVSDIKPLKGLKSLKMLSIVNCENITDEQVEELQKALPELGIIRNNPPTPINLQPIR